MAKKKVKKNAKFKFPAVVLEPVKTFLQEELKKLKNRREQIGKDDPFVDPDRSRDNAPDIDADEQFGHARSEAVKKQINRRMIQIKKALARIRIGRYGICEKCGQFINTERLMIYPETTLCVNCMRKQSKKS